MPSLVECAGMDRVAPTVLLRGFSTEECKLYFIRCNNVRIIHVSCCSKLTRTRRTVGHQHTVVYSKRYKRANLYKLFLEHELIDFVLAQNFYSVDCATLKPQFVWQKPKCQVETKYKLIFVCIKWTICAQCVVTLFKVKLRAIKLEKGTL